MTPAENITDSAEASTPDASAAPGDVPNAELVARLRDGSDRAARELFDRFRDAVMGYCVVSADGDRNRAKDLVQESFIRVFDNIDQLEEPENFSSWLWTIVRRRCADAGTRRSRHGEILDMFAFNRDVLLSHEDKLARERRIQCVRSILDCVDDDQLEQIVKMKYTEPEHTTREIAKKLDVPHGTVTVKLMRFRERIEEDLAEKLEQVDWSQPPLNTSEQADE